MVYSSIRYLFEFSFYRFSPIVLSWLTEELALWLCRVSSSPWTITLSHFIALLNAKNMLSMIWAYMASAGLRYGYG